MAGAILRRFGRGGGMATVEVWGVCQWEELDLYILEQIQ